VNKGAGLDITVGIYMQVVPAAGNATVDILTVIPEVNQKDIFLLSKPANLMVHIFTLLRSNQQF